MGVLKNVVDSVDTSSEQQAAIQESLDLLVELTENKAKEFKQTIEESLNRGRILGKGDSVDSLYYPITSVLDSRMEYRCITQKTPTDILSVVGESISGMIDDHSASGIVNGITKLVNKSLEPLLGLADGKEQFCSSTSTFIEGTGVAVRIVRFDTMIWGRTVKAASIKQILNETFACVAYKSVVNIRKITLSDFLAVYGPILENSGQTDAVAAIEYAKKIYNLLDGGADLVPKNDQNKADAFDNIIPKELNITAENLINHSEPVIVEDNYF